MLNDLKVALAFLTRIPINHGPQISLRRSAALFPLVGALIGLIGGLVFYLSSAILPPLVSASISILVTVAITGAFHLDGLADICDGLIGGWNREERLKILKDSRHGTYGVAAISLQLILQVCLLSALSPRDGLFTLIVLHTLSRLVPIFLMLIPATSGHDGMGASVSREIGAKEPIVGSLITVLLIAPIMGLNFLLLSAILFLTLSIFALWVIRKIGGMVGDAFGAGEQISETMILFFFVAQFGIVGEIPWII
ncbi:MAG: adenosylcobinamide-GDP ribazoletransferase [Actinomycetales bacterium]|nr:adenosylcobinamide-GDP ribazoletransferase [Actinomycetales bacterium]